MSADFFSNPENRVVLQICRTSPGFIPIVVEGKLHPVREMNIDLYPVSGSLSIEDFVLGLEVLGCRVVRNENDDVVVWEPTTFKDSVWETRSRQIQAVISLAWGGRRIELSDYIHQRSGKVV